MPFYVFLCFARVEMRRKVTGVPQALLKTLPTIAALLVAFQLEGFLFRKWILHFDAVGCDEFQKALCPYLSKSRGTCLVGMQIEMTGLAVLFCEQGDVVLEVFPHTTMPGIDLLVLCCDCIEEGIVAVKSVELGLYQMG